MSPKVIGSAKDPTRGGKNRGGGRGGGRGRGGAKAKTRAKTKVKAKRAYKDTTDPGSVTRPVTNLVDPALATAWSVNKKHKMAFIFDAINPARQFKRDQLYDDDADDDDAFAKYDPSPESDSDVTECDSDGDLQPYEPIHHT